VDPLIFFTPGPEYENPIRVPTPVEAVISTIDSRVIKLFNILIWSIRLATRSWHYRHASSSIR